MNSFIDFEVKRYDFDDAVFGNIEDLSYVKDLWPLVYILSDGKEKEAYVGETTDALSRMSSHLKNNVKSKLTAVHLITSEKFNKSAALDIESNLIKYMSGDGQFKLLNANVGLANHNYFQKKEVYWDIFKSVWDNLRSQGITKHSIDFIDNSDLFKYSPYKTLTREQRLGLRTIIDNLLVDEHKTILIEGGAGTGKTILAIFLFKLINSDNLDFNFKEFGEDEDEFIDKIKELKSKFPNPTMALVIPMSSFRKTLQKVFKNIKGLSAKMVIGPAALAKQKYDIVLVDESHRLRRRLNLGAYFGAFDKANAKLELDKHRANELDWVILQANKSILFYDENQSIKPSDVQKEHFDRLKKKEGTKIEYLKSQFRVRGGNDYVRFIEKVLSGKSSLDSNPFQSKNYEFALFDRFEEFTSEMTKRNQEHGLSRMIAGYSWPWISNKDENAFDIQIENIQLQWNRTNEDWINSPNSHLEVGCIHTTQGYDLNYAGIIFGHEISYDPIEEKIIILEENYFDKLGKQSVRSKDELHGFIINIYKTILLRGIKGTYVYACDENLRNYLANFIPAFHSEKEAIALTPPLQVVPYVNSIPLYDLQAAAGEFSEPQRVEDCEWLQLPERHTMSRDYFACQIIGESMNKVIPNGSICLFKKYTGGSRNGCIVLAERSDVQDPETGSSYTVKEYHSQKQASANSWEHTSIFLKPLSNDRSFEPIQLEASNLQYLRIIGEFVAVLNNEI
jgi:DUF2075 family protein/predicted GIY-YIG superfamily endonuclease